MLRPEGGRLTPDQLAAEEVFCSSWVFTFSGVAVDLEELGAVSRERGVRLG